ncbi:MAG: protein BatD [Elusimicrobia bacterium]|nr:protein BatD [Elusimicrobiota bacterium]
MKRFVFIWALMTAGGSARAGDVSFTARVDRAEITMNDNLTLQLTLSGEGAPEARPRLPAIPGFQTAFAGQSQNFSFINGAVSRETTYTYALSPQSPGEHTLPPFALDVKGRRLTTDPIVVKVRSGGVLSDPAPNAPGPPPAADVHDGRDLFVTTAVDKKDVVVGEAVTLKFRFYTRVPLVNQPQYRPAETTGFLTEDLPPQKQYTTLIGGRQYQVIELATALFPIAPGRATVGAAALECGVRDPSRGSGGFPSFFDDFFASGRRVVLRSDPLEVNVRPLPPENRPPGFKGDVGRYRISARLDKATAALHEPVALTVTVEGDGNVKALSQPALPNLDGFKKYETLSSLNIDNSGGRVRGSKIFTTVLKPDVSGDLSVPPVSFNYYEPGSGYKTVQSTVLKLSVRQAAEDPTATGSPPAGAGETPTGIKQFAQDIRYIQPSADLSAAQKPLRKRNWFCGLLWAPGTIFVFVFLVDFLRRRLDPDILSGSPARRARRALTRAVQTPADPARRFEALHRIYLEYLGRRLRVPAAGLTSEAVGAGLARFAVSFGTGQRAAGMWERFDRARYAPGALTIDDAARAASELRVLIGELEKGFNKK